MKKYQTYIAKLCLHSFFKVLIFFSVIIVCIKTLNFVEKINKEASVDLKTIGLIVFSVLPNVVVNLIPFSLGIACYMVYSSLLSSSQITILQNSGVHKLKLTSIPFLITVPLAICIIYLESNILIYTTTARKKIQHSIISEQRRYFLIPNKIKTFNDLTIITSPLNKNGKIPMTFLHKQTPNGFMLLVGNIEESWSVENFLGIKATNATILTTDLENQNKMQFKTLEIQLDVLNNETLVSGYSTITTPELLEKYRNTNESEAKNQIMKIINQRIAPAFLAILMPFILITLKVKYHNNRRNISISSIIQSFILLLYSMFCCFSMSKIFTSIDNFYYIYLNIFLTFLFVCILNFNIRNFFKK